MASTHLKNSNQIGSSPQGSGLKLKKCLKSPPRFYLKNTENFLGQKFVTLLNSKVNTKQTLRILPPLPKNRRKCLSLSFFPKKKGWVRALNIRNHCYSKYVIELIYEIWYLYISNLSYIVVLGKLNRIHQPQKVEAIFWNHLENIGTHRFFRQLDCWF